MALLIDNYRALLKGHEYFKAWEDELCLCVGGGEIFLHALFEGGVLGLLSGKCSWL